MRSYFFFCSAAVLLLAFTIRVKPVNLRYSFKNGDEHRLIQDSKQVVKQTIPGMGETETEISMSGTVLFKVIETSEGSARMEAQYEKLKVTTKGPMMNVVVDSDGSSDKEENRILNTMMNKPFGFVLSDRGEISEVSNVENLYSGLASLGLDETKLATTKEMFKQSLSESAIKYMLETSFIAYPKEKVNAGGNWSNALNATIGLPLVVDNTWTLTTVEGDVARLDADASVTTSDKTKVTTLPNGLKSRSDLEGRQAMKGKVDLTTGWPSEVKLLSEIKGKMTLLAGGMVPEDTDIPMTITNESTFTFTRK